MSADSVAFADCPCTSGRLQLWPGALGLYTLRCYPCNLLYCLTLLCAGLMRRSPCVLKWLTRWANVVNSTCQLAQYLLPGSKSSTVTAARHSAQVGSN